MRTVVQTQSEPKLARARKDERPNLRREGKIWQPVEIILNGTTEVGLIASDEGHWLYFEQKTTHQWFKMNLAKYELPEPTLGEPYIINSFIPAPQSEEERRMKKRARRQARRLAARAGIDEEEDEFALDPEDYQPQ
jgi:hypothetical protein